MIVFIDYGRIDINCIKWINKKEVSNYKFNDEDMKILEDFFNN